LPGLAEVRPDRFLPSSRSLGLHRNVWQQVGGYPDWLDYGEDVVFDLDLRRSLGARFLFEPRAVAYFRPRSSLAAFFRQYYRYARGDGKANLWPERHAIRYGVYALGLWAAAWLLSGAWQSNGARRLTGLMALVGGTCYLRRPATRLLDQAGDAKPLELAAMLALLPLLRATGDLAKMSGYPVGTLWRWRRRQAR
ncbi:MAG: glycosyltransferase, partial [Chloroflexota bacterium]